MGKKLVREDESDGASHSRSEAATTDPARLKPSEEGKAIGSADPDRSSSSSSVDATARLIEKKGDTRMDTTGLPTDNRTAPTNQQAPAIQKAECLRMPNMADEQHAAALDRIREVYPIYQVPCPWCGSTNRGNHGYDCAAIDVHYLLAFAEPDATEQERDQLLKDSQEQREQIGCLLAALKLAESVYRQNVVAEGEPSSVLDAMQAAIAKAEGR